jgi:hypothetical protein
MIRFYVSHLSPHFFLLFTLVLLTCDTFLCFFHFPPFFFLFSSFYFTIFFLFISFYLLGQERTRSLFHKDQNQDL